MRATKRLLVYAVILLALSAEAQITQTPDGNVGIGTTNPQARLHVFGSGNQVILMQSSDASYPGLQWFNATGQYTNQLDATDASLYWYNGSTRNMTLAQNGFLGIGTAVPPYTLTVAPNGTGSGLGIGWNKGNVGLGETDFYNYGQGGVGGFQFWNYNAQGGSYPTTGAVNLMTLSASGNVGIGTTTPGDLLVTSSTVGYVMKGTDRTQLTGAIVGKALGNLESGTGVIESNGFAAVIELLGKLIVATLKEKDMNSSRSVTFRTLLCASVSVYSYHRYLNW